MCAKLLSLSSVCVEVPFTGLLGVFAAALGTFPIKQVGLLSGYVRHRKKVEVKAAALGVPLCRSRIAESVE